MNRSRPTEQSELFIAAAADALTRARTLLLQPSPQNLDIACAVLATAMVQVTGLQTALTSSPSRRHAGTLACLHNELALISRLLEHAAAYHANLIQCMIEASGALLPPAPQAEPLRALCLDA